jgi:mRNA interferase MazF
VVGASLAQGQVWWAELPARAGSAPGFRRPVLVVQGNAFNRSRIATVIVVPLTRNLCLAEAPGNVLLGTRDSGLPKDSVANVSHVVTIDRTLLKDLVSQLTHRHLVQVLAGIDIVLGRAR